MRRRLCIGAALAAVSLVILGSAPVASPASSALPGGGVAALGDSLSQAFGAGGGGQNYPSESWSTGTDPAANSHYLRLLADGAGIARKNYDDAISGTSMVSTNAQASNAVSQGVGYVTVWSGTNDVCMPTTAQMTTVANYSSQLSQTLTTLTNGLPGVQILVVSIPNWYGFWQSFQGNSSAQAAWAAYSDRCPDLLSSSATAADRQAVAQRINDLNAADQSVCSSFSGCRYDGGAVYNMWASLTSADLTFDYFHLSVSGEAKVAAAAWPSAPFAGTAQSLLGYPAVGALRARAGASYLDVSGPWSLTQTATILQLTGYLSGGAGGGKLRAVVYADSGGRPGPIVATSNQITVSANQAGGWVTFPLPSPISLGAGGYWLGYWFGDSSTSFPYDAGLTSERYVPATYASSGSAPNFSGGASSNSDYSLYATLGGGAGPPPPPSNTAPPVVSGTPTQGQTLTTTTGSWTNSPTSFAYQWQRCDSAGASCAAIAGSTSSSYVLQAADVNSTIRSEVTASNAGGSSSPASSSPTAVVTGSGSGGTANLGQTQVGTLIDRGSAGFLDMSGPYSLPSSASISSVNAYVAGGSGASRIRVVVYADGGGKPGAFVAVTPETTIAAGRPAGWLSISFAGAVNLAAGSYWLGYWYGDGNSSHYYVSASGSERYVQAAYSSTGNPPATFGTGGSSVSSYSLYATYTTSGGGGGGGSAPTNTTTPSVSGTAQEGQTLTANPGAWANSPTSFAYQWGTCDGGGGSCTDIGGATGSTYVVDGASVGRTIRVSVTATNGAGSGSAVSAATAVVKPAGSTFGVTTIGATTTSGGAGFLDSSGPFTVSGGASVSKLTAYLAGGGQATSLRLVLYADDGTGKPGALAGVSNEVTLAAGQGPGWVAFTLPSPVSIAAGTYWLGLWIGGPSGIYYYDSVAGSERYIPDPYSSTGLPNNPYGSSPGSSSSFYSIYATYS
jgi:lysophospholipase L1-like esterase